VLLTVRPDQANALEVRLGEHGLIRVGTIDAPANGRGYLRITQGGQTLVDVGALDLCRAFQEESHGS
jgi:hypothetical protein